jgi:hypothetical protein
MVQPKGKAGAARRQQYRLLRQLIAGDEDDLLDLISSM